MRTKLVIGLSVFAAAILVSCGKVKNSDIKQGEYKGVIKIYNADSLFRTFAYEIDLDRTTYDAEVKEAPFTEEEGTFTVSGNDVTFVPLYPTNTEVPMLSGKYQYDYNKNSKKLLISRSDAAYKIEYDLVRIDD